jgi:hypothetical protein
VRDSTATSFVPIRGMACRVNHPGFTGRALVNQAGLPAAPGGSGFLHVVEDLKLPPVGPANQLELERRNVHRTLYSAGRLPVRRPEVIAPVGLFKLQECLKGVAV